MPASSGFPGKLLSTVNSIRQCRDGKTNANAEEEWKSNRNYFRAWQLCLLAADLRDRGARFYIYGIESHFHCVTRFKLTILRAQFIKYINRSIFRGTGFVNVALPGVTGVHLSTRHISEKRKKEREKKRTTFAEVDSIREKKGNLSCYVGSQINLGIIRDVSINYTVIYLFFYPLIN